MSVNINQSGTLVPLAGYGGSADAEHVPYDNTSSGLVASNVQDALDDINKVNTFAVATTAWVANTDSSTNTDYPFVANISTTEYTNASVPVWHMTSSNTIPTKADTTEIAKVLQAYFTSTTVTLYATEKPSIALNLVAKGV